MTNTTIPELNYGDFYKFITSFTLISAILGIVGTTYIVLNANFTKIVVIIGIISYSLIAIVSIVFFLWATNKWYNNQKKLDQKLEAEVTLKLLEIKRKVVLYETQIDKLSLNQHPFPQIGILNNLKKNNARQRVEKQLKGLNNS